MSGFRCIVRITEETVADLLTTATGWHVEAGLPPGGRLIAAHMDAREREWELVFDCPIPADPAREVVQQDVGTVQQVRPIIHLCAVSAFTREEVPLPAPSKAGPAGR